MTAGVRRSRTLFAAAVIAALALAAYSNSFTPIFAGADAKESIRDNPHVKRLWPLSEAMSLPLLATTLADDPDSKGGTVVRRPILSLSFALTHGLFGPEPWGFHATNLAIHVAAGLVLFGLARRTLLLPVFGGRYRHRARWLALVIAALWIGHPVQTESVTYLVQRAESQMGLLYLLTLYCAVRGLTSASPGRWHACAVTACALGMGTKEAMVTAPVMVLLYDRVFVSSTPTATRRGRIGLYAGLFATWLVLGALLLAPAADVGSDFDAASVRDYALSQPRVILHYLRLAVWPHPLYLYVDTATFDVGSAAEAVGPALLVSALLAATAWGVYRRRTLAILGAWFFVILAPTSSFVAISDVIQEHRMYLPLAAPIALVVLGFDGLAARLTVPPRLAGGLGVTLALIVALACVGLTRERNRDYHDEFSMIHPADLHEQFMILAQHYLHRGELDAAARGIVPPGRTTTAAEKTFAQFALGLAALERDDHALAASHLQEAVRLDHEFAYAHKELCAALRQQGDLEQAVSHCREALARKPSFPEADNELGMVLAQLGETDSAERSFREALRRRPTFADAHLELGILLASRGDAAAAAEHFDEALRIRPDLDEARRRLAEIRE